MKRNFFILILFFLLADISFPQSNKIRDFSAVDKIIINAISDKSFPAAQLLIGDKNDILYYKNYGTYSYDDSKLLTDSSIFDVASLTKVIATTSCAMALYEKGLLDLDDYVTKYIPEFASNGKDKIKIKNLLYHNSGLTAWIPFYKTCKNKDDIFKTIYALKPEYPTDSIFIYSDLNMVILQQVIEEVSGKSLEELSSEIIFAPLGMAYTCFNPRQKMNCVPTEIDSAFRHTLLQGICQDETAYILNGVSGNAGLFSNAKDLYLFMNMMLNQGSMIDKRRMTSRPIYVRIFKEQTVELFTSKLTTDKYQNTRALGWDTKPISTQTLPAQCGNLISENSFGHTGYTGTSIWCDKERGLIIILLTNRTYPHRENQAIKSIRPLIHDEIIKIFDNK